MSGLGGVSPGERYGKLVATRVARRVGFHVLWRCSCDCGASTIVRANQLRTGSTRSCGCLRGEVKRKDLTGKRFGRLVAVERDPEDVNRWLCRCACGRQRSVAVSNLRPGGTKSCGCRSHTAEHLVRHGEARAGRKTAEYRTWIYIKYRCLNSKGNRWPYYGGRGIRMCRRWQKSFAAFLADMGRKPSARHEIDRIDNDGHYEPGNCRWATKKQQAGNRRVRSRPGSSPSHQ